MGIKGPKKDIQRVLRNKLKKGAEKKKPNLPKSNVKNDSSPRKFALAKI